MAFYVFVTGRCSDEAKKHGQDSVIKNLKTKAESTQNLVGFNFHSPTPFLKKGLGRSFRLIAYRIPIDDDELIVFLSVLARGGSEYKFFLANWDKNTKEVERKLSVPSEEESRSIHAELTKTTPPSLPSPPNEEELMWLYSVLREEKTEKDELLVLETEAWVKKMRSPSMRDFLALYHQLLEQIDLTKLPPSGSNTDFREYWDEKRRRGFAYVYKPEHHRLLILEPLEKSDDVSALVKRHILQLTNTNDQPHELSRLAARSYPYLMVLDQDTWLAIQKDEEANLALSPEEADLLESIRSTGIKGELGYPLFINGRAGSGKSTMLQYLAADYIDFALRRRTQLQPIYMTCSRDLLQRARQTVMGLLTTHHERLLKEKHDPLRVKEILDRTFVVFHDYLYSLLPSQMRQKLSPKQFVNYPEFRRLWEKDFAKRPEARHISMDLAWHTIRSYIKGMRSACGDELTPEEFAALPKKQRSVSVDSYEAIYRHVWDSWYKRLCEDGEYWDDQDLAASLLEAGAIKQVAHAAIFCDEAQDFTPIELELILQMSVFSRRSLQPEQMKRVPFVFAGDPLQTVNPTGFRWSAVQADFHDRFCAVLDPRRRARVEINYKELKFNYRSNPGIVKFCNLIQLMRAALVGGEGIQPQEAWWVEAPVQPVWFTVDNAQTKDQLQKRSEIVKIINCEEGEETNYASQDSLLKTLGQEREGIFQNILGPMRAKGLEFPAVTLYRFGEKPPKEFGRLLTGDIDVHDDPEARLPYEYFLNRLYVAASRAKGRLSVIDSRDAIDNFWRFATDADMIDALVVRTGGKDLWKDKITFLVEGREGDWKGERIDPHEQAREYENQGKRKRDSYLLRQAALAYRSAGEELKAGKCLALAFEFENKLEDAGKKYEELGLHNDAFRCYWEGQHLKAICSLTAHVPALASRPESRAADFVEQTHGVPAAFLSIILESTASEEWVRDVANDATWRHVFSKLVERLSKVNENATIQWNETHRMIERLSAAGIALHESQRALIAYRAGQYLAAVQLWDASGHTEDDGYRRAKARLEPFPRNLIWYAKLKDNEQVLNEWLKNRHIIASIEKLDRDILFAVMDAAIAKDERQLAIEMLEVNPERNRLETLLAIAVKEGNADLASTVSALVARLFVHTKAWNTAVKAAEDADFAELRGVDTGTLSNLLRQSGGADKIFETVLFELATSDHLPSETPERQTPVSDFLYRHFITRTPSRTRQVRLPIEVVGAAIERAGRIVNALQYYENLSRDPSLPQEKRDFAVQRLVRNLEKHAEYFRSTGDIRQAEEREERARKMRKSFDLGSMDLPDYPVVRKGSLELDGPAEWNKGPYKIVLSRVHNRLRIEHTERFETVTVYGMERQLKGDAIFSDVSLSEGEIAVWSIDDWGMTIRLLTVDGSMKVRAEFEDNLFEVNLSC